MAENKKSEEDQKLAYELRKSVANAYAAVAGDQASATFSATTLEECIDRRIDYIEGSHPDGRLNALERIDKIEQELTQAVAKIKTLPADFFNDRDEERDVNGEA